MSDEALWELRGHERVVFDIKKEMQLDLDSESLRHSSGYSG